MAKKPAKECTGTCGTCAKCRNIRAKAKAFNKKKDKEQRKIGQAVEGDN